MKLANDVITTPSGINRFINEVVNDTCRFPVMTSYLYQPPTLDSLHSGV